MRASAFGFLLSCLASSIVAFHGPPLHRHRHNDSAAFFGNPNPEHDRSAFPGTGYTMSASSVVNSPIITATTASSVIPANQSPASSTASSMVSVNQSPASSAASSVAPANGSPTSSTASSVALANRSPTSSAASSMAPANRSPTSSAASSVALANGSASTIASSTATPSQSGAYKFSALVAFGDNLSDNGNGSYAHNVAANNPSDVVDGNTIYGARTWTDGPVAVSYLTDLLGVPMTQNFAFGHAWGGSDFGATIDDTMQQSNFSASLADGPWFNSGEFSEPCWGAPSAKVQINDYIKGGVNKEALHFLWIGANDMNAAYYGTLGIDRTTLNDDFVGNISTKITDLVSTLLDAGAPYVFVANLYPKNLAPLWPNFLGITTTSEWDALGDVINSANTALETALKALPNADRVIYYDAFTFMSNLYANPGSAFPNIKDTNGFPSFCDGDKEETAFMLSINDTVIDGVTITKNWDYCFTLKHGDEWYWMQYLDPTTHVHQLVAQDMEATVKAFPFPT